MLTHTHVNYLLCLWLLGINVARYYWIMEPMFSMYSQFIAHCKMPLIMMMSRLFDVMFPVQYSTRDIGTGPVTHIQFCTLSLNAKKKYVSTVISLLLSV